MNNKEFQQECSRESKEYYKRILCKRGDISLEKVFEDGFMAGVEYCINSVWHTTADMPEKWKLCLVEYKDSDGENKTRIDWRSEYEWVGMCHYDTILRWAYVSDLLPGGGAQ